jgi:hypothetical protein
MKTHKKKLIKSILQIKSLKKFLSQHINKTWIGFTFIFSIELFIVTNVASIFLK